MCYSRRLSLSQLWNSGIKTVVITEGQILPAKRRSKENKEKERRTEAYELFGSHIRRPCQVHQAYGIGRFMGIVKMPVDGKERDYIKIAYAGSDKLYVPGNCP